MVEDKMLYNVDNRSRTFGVNFMKLVSSLLLHKYIIPDILSPKTTRAFWRQINFNINKPAPLGAKLLGAFHWKCSTPFYS
jgi:hypothetical protein